MTAALLDTSTLLADFASLGSDLPDEMAISVITLGELQAGVRLARGATARAARQRRFNAVREAFDPIPVDENVAERYGEALATARSEGRSTKATDLLIVATAAATGRVLHTLDKRQAALATALGLAVHC